jgi:hypothetical protein
MTYRRLTEPSQFKQEKIYYLKNPDGSRIPLECKVINGVLLLENPCTKLLYVILNKTSLLANTICSKGNTKFKALGRTNGIVRKLKSLE